jgi:lipase chaperone LimK
MSELTEAQIAAAIKMQDVTQTHQVVHALAVRAISGGPWRTAGVHDGENIQTTIARWEKTGYEVRLMRAELPVARNP